LLIENHAEILADGLFDQASASKTNNQQPTMNNEQ
jgi:hypothetical protein